MTHNNYNLSEEAYLETFGRAMLFYGESAMSQRGNAIDFVRLEGHVTFFPKENRLGVYGMTENDLGELEAQIISEILKSKLNIQPEKKK